MPLPYKPMTKQQDQERNLIPEGEYCFTVLQSTQKRNKANTMDMLEIELELHSCINCGGFEFHLENIK